MYTKNARVFAAIFVLLSLPIGVLAAGLGGAAGTPAQIAFVLLAMLAPLFLPRNRETI